MSSSIGGRASRRSSRSASGMLPANVDIASRPQPGRPVERTLWRRASGSREAWRRGSAPGELPGGGQRMVSTAFAADGAEMLSLTAAPSPVVDAAATVRRWFQFANLRDVNAMGRLVSDDCRHFDLERSQWVPGSGKERIFTAYRRFVDSLPADVEFVIEDLTAGESGNVGVIWHLTLAGQQLADAHGVSWFSVDMFNRICYVRESPEAAVRALEPVLPLLDALAPLVKAGLQLPPTPLLPLKLPELLNPLEQPQAVLAGVGDQLSALTPTALLDGLVSALRGAAGPASPALLPFIEHWNFKLKEAGLSSFSDGASPSPAPFLDIGAAFAAFVPSMSARSADDGPEAGAGPSGRSETPTTRGGVLAQEWELQSPAGEKIAMRALPLSASDPSLTGMAAREGLPIAPDVRSGPDSGGNGQPPTSSSTPQADAAATQEHVGALAGTWKKLQQLSDVEGYGRALDLLGVGGIQKQTALMIDGLEVKHTAAEFELFFLTVVPYFKVTEAYKIDQEVTIGRRDLRSGGQKAMARQRGARVVVDLAWGAPKQGTGHEEYWLNDAGQLCVESTVTVGGASETTLQVYERQDVGDMDKRYFSEKRSLPFGIDPNKISADMIKMFT